MKLLVLSTTNNLSINNHKDLEASLIHHGYDYYFHEYPFQFGSQYKVIAEYVNNYQGDATHIVYLDAWDSIAVAPPSEVRTQFNYHNCKMLISAEKAYFPDDGQSHLIPESNSAWRFINGGGCMFDIQYFKQLVLNNPMPTYGMMDPHWLRDCLVTDPTNIKIDTDCTIFQTLSHCNEDEFAPLQYLNKTIAILNKATQTQPIFFHHNGIKNREDVKWLYDYHRSQIEKVL